LISFYPILASIFYLASLPRASRKSGLATDDRIVGLIGNAMEISPGHRLTAGSATCDGLGFALIAVLWTEHLWTLCLAIGTYLILIHVRPPFSLLTDEIEA